MRKNIALLVLLLGLNGCASLSQEECLTGDWYGIGYSDGIHGRKEGYLANHQKACAEYQIKIDHNQYLSGRDEGVKSYCQPHNGYTLGRSGAEYQYICPDNLETDFLKNYQYGRTIYLQELKVTSLEAELDRLKDELRETKDRTDENEHKLIHETATPQQRAQHLTALRSLESKQSSLKWEIKQLQNKIRQEKQKLAEMISL